MNSGTTSTWNGTMMVDSTSKEQQGAAGKAVLGEAEAGERAEEHRDADMGQRIDQELKK